MLDNEPRVTAIRVSDGALFHVSQKIIDQSGGALRVFLGDNHASEAQRKMYVEGFTDLSKSGTAAEAMVSGTIDLATASRADLVEAAVDMHLLKPAEASLVTEQDLRSIVSEKRRGAKQ